MDSLVPRPNYLVIDKDELILWLMIDGFVALSNRLIDILID